VSVTGKQSNASDWKGSGKKRKLQQQQDQDINSKKKSRNLEDNTGETESAEEEMDIKQNEEESEEEIEDRASDSDSSSEGGDLGDMYSARIRYQLNKLAATGEIDGKGDDSADEEDDSAEENTEAIDVEKGPFSDLMPIGEDLDNPKGFRCKHCPKKIMHSESDITQHLTSSGHKKRFRQSKRKGSIAKPVSATKQEKHKAWVEKRKLSKEERRAKKKERQKDKLKKLGADEIEKRKAKAKAKYERRRQRKAGEKPSVE